MPDLSNITFRDYMRILFRQKAVIITTFITVMVTISIGLMLKTPVYEASVKMLVSAEKQVESPYYHELIDSQNTGAIATQAEIVKSDPILERTVRALGLYAMPLDYEKRFSSPLKSFFVNLNVKVLNTKLGRLNLKEQQGLRYRMAMDQLRENISIEPIRDTSMFYIKVRDFSAYGSAILANVVSRSYVIFDLEQQVAELQLKYGDKNLAVTQLKDDIAKMEKSLNGEPVGNIDAIGPASVKIIEQAEIPIQPTGLPKILTMVLGFFMSIFLAIILTFTLDYMDQTIKEPREIESFFNLLLLGSVPKVKSKLALFANLPPKNMISSISQDYFRDLSDQLRILMKNKGYNTFLLTGPDKREGVTTVIANLAFYISQFTKLKVLIVDTNFHNPSMHKIFKLSQAPGLADILSNKTNNKSSIHEINPYLYVLTNGETHINPVSLLDSPHMKEYILELKHKFDVILFDGVDLKNYKDSLFIATNVEGMILLIAQNKTRRQVIEKILLSLKEHKINTLGAILNSRTFAIPKFVYKRI